RRRHPRPRLPRRAARHRGPHPMRRLAVPHARDGAGAGAHGEEPRRDAVPRRRDAQVMIRRQLMLCLAAILLAAPAARAWEADSTHVGLTEQAALASKLHARLQALFLRRGGWLESLRLAPERAPALYKKLGLLEPTSGVVP